MKLTNKQVTKANISDYREKVKLAAHKKEFQALLDKFVEEARHDLIMIDNTYHWVLKSVSIGTAWYENTIDIDISWHEYKGDPDNFCIEDAIPSAEGIDYIHQIDTKLQGLKVKLISIVKYKWTPAEYAFWSDLGIIHHQTSSPSTYKTMSCSL